MRLAPSLLLVALAGCPWVGTEDYRDNVQDADGDGVIGVRFGGRDCQDDNPEVGNCDADDDGHLSVAAGGDDCDDNAADIHPDAEERCDLVDNDCDGAIDAEDDDVVATLDLWRDADGDGEGDPDVPVVCQEYTDPSNPATGIHSRNADDCDDNEAEVNTSAVELCDGFDNNCDGVVDDVGLWLIDADNDGFGQNGTQATGSCDLSSTTGLAAVGDDCDDNDPDAYPEAPEVPYDGVDQNCNGGLDDWDTDFDGHVPADHFPAAQAANEALPNGQQWSIQSGDCDDTDPRRFVGNTEVCDGVDNDCDEQIDAADLLQAAETDEPVLRSQVTLVYLDMDGDDHGGTPVLVCPVGIDPAIHHIDFTDCYDNPLEVPDGYGSADPAAIHADADELCDGVDNDCDTRIDWANTPFPGSATFFVDGDADGFGTTEVQACGADVEAGLAAEPGDCDDGDAGRFPGAPEICGNAVREDCVTELCDEDGLNCVPASPYDCDLDGFEGSYQGNGDGSDCEDESSEAYPGRPEICDGLDNDCNGAVDADDGNVDASVLPDWFPDTDGDGWGDSDAVPLQQCDSPGDAYTIQAGDCDDSDPLSSPDGPWFLDSDGDGYGSNATRTVTGTCSPPPADPAGVWVRLGDDCNNADPVYSPETVWYLDSDQDYVGDPSNSGVFCSPPAGESWALAAAGTDCNDNDSAVQGTRTFYRDDDGDGSGSEITVSACSQPVDGYTWVLNGGDCDDTESGIHPQRLEVCNAIDDDCDGLVDDEDSNLVASADGPLGYADIDGDGFGDDGVARTFCFAVPTEGWSATAGDCNDDDAAVNPAAQEVCGNDLDDDCDGEQQIPSWYVDDDGDGFGIGGVAREDCAPPAPTGYATRDGDCDDDDDARFPGAAERDFCDAIDDDCDGQPEPRLTWTFDADGDGYGDDATADTVCSPPTALPPGRDAGTWILQGGDCDDDDPGITFGRVFYLDADGDGLGNASSTQFECPPDDGSTVWLRYDANDNGLFDPGDEQLSAFEGDCDDDNPLVQGPRTFYVDEDRDTWGSTNLSPELICPDASNDAPVGYSVRVGDCVDNNDELNSPPDPDPDPDGIDIAATINPTAAEIDDDGEDNDCDGFVDDENATIRWYIDEDGDGFGSTLSGGYAPNAVTVPGDCDDSSTARHPAHPEICDGIGNNDCNAATPDPEIDADGDGFSACQGDPDDTNDALVPDMLTWYLDEDGDGFGSTVSITSPTAPDTDWVLVPGDCDDMVATTHPAAPDDACDGIDDNCNGVADEQAPSTAYFPDWDDDGQGAGGPAVLSCAPVPDHVTNDEDCDDDDDATFLGATELCDGRDNDCDGVTPPDELDSDGDGWLACEDCDDTNGARNPGQPEVCDGIVDNDCGLEFVDIEVDGDGDGYSTCQGDPDDQDALTGPNALTWYFDGDGDGFGGTLTAVAPDAPGPEWRLSFGDCDDADPDVRPGTTDATCDGIDNDCDGQVDEGATVLTAYFPDADGDGFGRDDAAPLEACSAPVGYVTDNSDCDDLDAAILPGAVELCDGLDNDCDGSLSTSELTDLDADGVVECLDCDDNLPSRYPGAPELCDGVLDNACDGGLDVETDDDGDGESECQGDPNDADPGISAVELAWYLDDDADGYGTGAPVLSVFQPPGFASIDGDCDDANPSANPEGIDDSCDGIDNDCSGIDGDEATAAPLWYIDADGDTYGDEGSIAVQACAAPLGMVGNDGDCDDATDAVHPGAAEICDGIDNDCDTVVPAAETEDFDADGVIACLDCDDTDDARFPGHPEICDGVQDNDCVAGPDPDVDDDADGATECEGDPNDQDPGITAPQLAWYVDDDADGFGTGAPVFAPQAPAGHVAVNGDCDDANPSTNPGVFDDSCDGTDQDCTGDDGNDDPARPVWYLDADGDLQGMEGSPGIASCIAPLGYIDNDDDCDDDDDQTYLGAPEVCDGIDNDCDSVLAFLEDVDVDMDGAPACNDCDDDDPARFPGNAEVCDGVLDNDCTVGFDPEVDGDGDGATTCEGDADDSDPLIGPPELFWYFDGDGDGYGTGMPTLSVLRPSVDHVVFDGDCDDGEGSIHPNAVDDQCDGIDDDCDGVADDDATTTQTFFRDVDGDGIGGPDETFEACPGVPPAGWSDRSDDCDDDDPLTHPDVAAEACDGKDNDCDTVVPIDEDDFDFDGQRACDGDCDDYNPDVFYGNPNEYCDGLDNNCDGGMADFGNGPTPDVPNFDPGLPAQITIFDFDRDRGYMAADTDGINGPSIGKLTAVCEEAHSPATVTYDAAPSIELHPIDDVALLTFTDCDDGSGTDGAIYFRDDDLDGVGNAEGPDDVLLADCGFPAPSNFALYTGEDDCDPYDGSRWHEPQEGLFYDLDGDGHVASYPYRSSSFGSYWCTDGVTYATAGIDCNDEDWNSDADVSYSPREIRSTTELDTALQYCREADLHLDPYMVDFGSQPIQPNANLTFQALWGDYYNCNDTDPGSCVSGTVDIPADSSVRFREIGFDGEITSVDSTANVSFDNTKLPGVRVDSDGYINVYQSEVWVDSVVPAFTVRNSLYTSDTQFYAMSDGLGVAVAQDGSWFDGSQTSFWNIERGIDATNGASINLSDASFYNVQHAVFAEDPAIAPYVSANRTSFDNLVGAALVGRNGAQIVCEECTATNLTDALIDVRDDLNPTDGYATLRNSVFNSLGVGPVLIRSGANGTEIDNVRMEYSDRPLLDTEGSFTIRDFELLGSPPLPLVQTTSTFGFNTVDGFEAGYNSNAGFLFQAAGGTFQANDIQVGDGGSAGFLQMTGAGFADVRIDNLSSQTGTATLLDIDGNAGTVSLTNLDVEHASVLLDATDVQGTLSNIRAEYVDQIVGLENGLLALSDIELQQSYGPLPELEVGVGGTLLATDTRILDVATNPGTPSLRAVSGGTLLMDHSIVWSTGGGGPLVTADDGSTVDMATTTLYSGSTSPAIDLVGTGTANLSVNRVLFHTGGCAVQGLGVLSEVDNWVDLSGNGCLLLSPTSSATTGNANFNTFTRSPLNTTVRTGWGELAP